MALLTLTSARLVPAPCSLKASVRGKRLMFPYDCSFRSDSIAKVGGFKVRAFFPNPAQEPILKEALKEPVAFVGGIFAGLLRLDLKEDPLKEWVAKTVEAAGITPEEVSKRDDEDDDQDTPQQIEIE